MLSGVRQWMDTQSVISAMHSLVVVYREAAAEFFTRPVHAHLFNRNNAFLMEIRSIEPRTRVGWVLAFFNLFARYKHLNLLRFEIR